MADSEEGNGSTPPTRRTGLFPKCFSYQTVRPTLPHSFKSLIRPCEIFRIIKNERPLERSIRKYESSAWTRTSRQSGRICYRRVLSFVRQRLNWISTKNKELLCHFRALLHFRLGSVWGNLTTDSTYSGKYGATVYARISYTRIRITYKSIAIYQCCSF